MLESIQGTVKLKEWRPLVFAQCLHCLWHSVWKHFEEVGVFRIPYKTMDWVFRPLKSDTFFSDNFKKKIEFMNL